MRNWEYIVCETTEDGEMVAVNYLCEECLDALAWSVDDPMVIHEPSGNEFRVHGCDGGCQ